MQRDCEDKPSANGDDLIGGHLKEHHISFGLEQMKLCPDVSKPSEEVKEHDMSHADVGSDHQLTVEGSLDDLYISPEAEADENGNEFDSLEIASETDGSIATSAVDDASSEQSWMLRSLSDSSVACVTSDYAMQNVILQIGLRLLAPGGMLECFW